MSGPPDEMQALMADLQALQAQIAALTARVYRLEQAARQAGVPETKAPQSSPDIASSSAASLVNIATPSTVSPAASILPVSRPTPAGIKTSLDGNLESRIGSEWLNRIGIVAVLFGVSFFLKYAFENNWIGPGTRVLIGIAAGIGVLIWSERFRRTGYLLFSYSLKAVGIGVLYLSLWAAFAIYALVPASLAFGAMVAVTALTTFLAIRQNAAVLAAFALVGGFITPVLVSTHQNREFALFSYVTLLDVGVLVLIAFRPWRMLAVGAFFGTMLLYIAWYTDYYTRPQLDPTLVFAAIFFVIFSLVPVASARREPLASPGGDISNALILLPLLNSGIFFIEVWVMLETISLRQVAAAAIAISTYYLLLSWLSGAELVERERRLMRMLHVGLAVAFVTIAVPLRYDGHWITIGWFVESAALLWIARRIDYGFLSWLAGTALALGVVRLLFIDSFHTQMLLLNERFFTYLIAIAIMAAIAWLGSQGSEAERQAARLASVAINALALVALTYEVSDAFSRALVGAVGEELRELTIARDFSYSALYMAYGAALMIVGFWRRSQLLRWQALVLIAIAVAKVFIYDTSQLDRIYRILSFISLGVLLLAISFAYQRDWLRLAPKKDA